MDSDNENFKQSFDYNFVSKLLKVGQTLQGVQEHFVHPTYQHGGELQLFPTNVEHQEDHQNEEYYQGNYPYEDEDVNTDLGL